MYDLLSDALLAKVGVPDKEWDGVRGEIIEDVIRSEEFLLADDEMRGDLPAAAAAEVGSAEAAVMEAVKERGNVLLPEPTRGEPIPGTETGKVTIME